MVKESKEIIFVGGGFIPAPPGSITPDSYLWEKVSDAQKSQKETRRLSQEKREICYIVADSISQRLYDLSSGGLGHKLGSVIKLTENDELAEEEIAHLGKEIGLSNFYAFPVSILARGRFRSDSIIPSWFFDHFSKKDRLKTLFSETNRLSKKATEELNKDDDLNINNLSHYAIKDLYCMYELAVIMFEFIEGKASGIVKKDFRPHDHPKERRRAWKSSSIVSNLRERFGWSRQGQPSLKELLDASYQVLAEKGEELGLEERPTRFTFEGEISP